MANVKFGISQIKAQTPKVAKYIFRAVLYTAFSVNIVLDVVTDIPPHIKVLIAKYSLYAVGLTHSLSKLWGIDMSDSQPPVPPFNRK